MLAKVSASEVGEALALRLSMLPLAALDLSGYLDFSSLRPLQTDQASLPPDPLLNPLPPAARPVAPKTAVLAAKSRTNPTIQRFPTFPHIPESADLLSGRLAGGSLGGYARERREWKRGREAVWRVAGAVVDACGVPAAGRRAYRILRQPGH